MLWNKNEPLYCERLCLSCHFTGSTGCLMVTNSFLTYQQQQLSLSHDAHQSKSQSHFTFCSLRNLVIYRLCLLLFIHEKRKCRIGRAQFWLLTSDLSREAFLNMINVQWGYIVFWSALITYKYDLFTVLVHLFAQLWCLLMFKYITWHIWMCVGSETLQYFQKLKISSSFLTWVRSCLCLSAAYFSLTIMQYAEGCCYRLRVQY